jgi:hypothetical protein
MAQQKMARQKLKQNNITKYQKNQQHSKKQTI